MSIVVSSPSDTGSVLGGAWSILTGIYSGPNYPKPLLNTKYLPDSSGHMNPFSDIAYSNIPVIENSRILQYPVVPSGGYSTSGELNPNAVDNMIGDTAKLSQDKIFQYFNSLDSSRSGYMDKVAETVNNGIPSIDNPFDLSSMFSTTTKVIAAAIIGYLLIK